MTWNIWNIKSKALRAIVAWLFAGLGAVIVLAALVPALVWLAIAGAIGGLRELWGNSAWRTEVFAPWWRAATGKEAV